MWKLYNQGLNGLTGEEDGPKPPHVPPPHMPVGLGPVPPQKEALNLGIKDEVSDIYFIVYIKIWIFSNENHSVLYSFKTDMSCENWLKAWPSMGSEILL